jgi:hypothetical protein
MSLKNLALVKNNKVEQVIVIDSQDWEEMLPAVEDNFGKDYTYVDASDWVDPDGVSSNVSVDFTYDGTTFHRPPSAPITITEEELELARKIIERDEKLREEYAKEPLAMGRETPGSVE